MQTDFSGNAPDVSEKWKCQKSDYDIKFWLEPWIFDSERHIIAVIL